MRGHREFDAESAVRPAGDRPTGAERDNDALTYAAATAGRPDVLGASGLLGLQRAVGNQAVGELLEPTAPRSPVHDVISSGGGAPLTPDVRSDMEARFGGQDFGDVRVHTDGAAHESAKSVNAQAYTVGSNIVFQRDSYDPSSAAGQHVLAHELTHVVQQRSGPVDGTDHGAGVKVSDPSDRFEREAVATADRLMSSPAAASPAPAAPVQRAAAHDGTDHPPVQRAEEMSEEDESAQTYVQRQAAGEEEESAEE
ncbi:protein of unknown function [Micromonospora pattaloongensis]|uniref:eCIS core domain-containing protein n=1 Tax=Micromonospora pattaloongensis TaxID=405436 RepID=A0A1H3R7W9_9ACTN|nr:DUF4157 domain-containing protein [Micromonospora pattaloongensis]SDZ21405.1 protein of unknown function [Micromonospora pattaloongensis]